jgi:hypothetical protein
MVGAKELQKALCHSLVHIKKGTRGAALNPSMALEAPVPLLQEGFDRIQECIKTGTQQVL